jgi:hypothetical protein
MCPNYIILMSGEDTIVAGYDLYKKVYFKMVTFHKESWLDTVSAAQDYIVMREQANKELADSILAGWKEFQR